MVDQIDALKFRQVLGNYPTGVTVITAVDDMGHPVGMVIGSFTSVSLEPPLIAYLPAKTSSTYPRLMTAEIFCVNILGSDQEPLSRVVGSKERDVFDTVGWRPSPSGAPIFDGALAWIECATERVIEAGDHYIVFGRVLDLDGGRSGLPLVFFRGGFGRFNPFSVVAPSQADIAAPIRLADTARDVMERLASTLGTEVIASAAVGDYMVTLASTGSPTGAANTWVGLRAPFVPPLGSIYLAWSETQLVDGWLSRLDGAADEKQLEVLRDGLERVRMRGWSMSLFTPETRQLETLHREIAASGLTAEAEEQVRRVTRAAVGDYNPELRRGERFALRLMNAPIFGPDGAVALTFQTHGEPDRRISTDELHERASVMRAATAEVTAMIGGKAPGSIQV